MDIKNEETRRYIYGIIVAASPLAIVYGIVNIEQAGLWVAFGGAILGLSNLLAFKNTKGKHEA